MARTTAVISSGGVGRPDLRGWSEGCRDDPALRMLSPELGEDLGPTITSFFRRHREFTDRPRYFSGGANSRRPADEFLGAFTQNGQDVRS